MDAHKTTLSLPMRVMKSPLGGIVARPWIDFCVLVFLKNWFFPLSRLWAAARVAEGDVDIFIANVPLADPNARQRKRIKKALNSFDRARLRAFSTEQLWNSYFFGSDKVAPERLPIVEEMRLDNRSAYNLTRKCFKSLRKLVKTSVKAAPPSPEEVERQYGTEAQLAALFALPESFNEIEVSRSISTASGCEYWLRFASGSSALNDLVYAHVFEPEDVRNPPTLIFGHGICVESDHYHQLLDEISDLTAMGIRVIKPEAPWHGRRVLPGHYGGEQLLSAIPASMIEFLAAQDCDWANLIDWCRRTSTGAVAIGGSSLGAQTAKIIAVQAKNWPEHLRPQALFVTAHCQHISETALDSSLSDIWNIGNVMRDKGWTRGLEKSWLEKLDPLQKPCMGGDKVVSVTGRHDTVTPMKTANEHMDFWQVPPENRFAYRRGHFSIPLGLIHDVAPLKKLADILLSQSPSS